MKSSELKKLLEESIIKHGDLECVLPEDCNGLWYPVKNVHVEGSTPFPDCYAAETEYSKSVVGVLIIDC